MAPSIVLIALPLIAFLLLLLLPKSAPKWVVSLIGCGGIFLSALYAFFLLWSFLSIADTHIKQTLWTILPAQFFSNSSLSFSLSIDSLSLTMAVVVTFVSSWISLYSSAYMAHEEGFDRFFAVVNLFVAFMLLLVLADSLWVLFIGWEGVGLCSYLLIGFYYKEKRAEQAAMKAFITTRVGDVFLLFAVFCCFFLFKTLDIQSVLEKAQALYPNGSILITITALFLLGGAVGKSAQFPLQTWLADAMWGPTPVSALIHAATMVTAGVYLIARMSGLFLLSDEARMVVMAIGLFTLIFSGIFAIFQTDLKRVLAYSTMSQIGYMFLALGASAYQAAIFHLATHAFFKALLFLAAGVIGHAVHSYQLSDMGGLRKHMPGLFWLFLIGCLSLVGFPFISAGFFSKEWIMSEVLLAPIFGQAAFLGAVFGSFLTGVYTFRMVVLVFFGESKENVHRESSVFLMMPLIVLAFFSITLGWLETPLSIANIQFISSFLSTSLPFSAAAHEDLLVLFIPAIAALLGAVFSIWLYGILRIQKNREDAPKGLKQIYVHGGITNWVYHTVIITPYVRVSDALKGDPILEFYEWLSALLDRLIVTLNRLHTGRLTHYLSFLVFAALALATVMVM